MCTSGQQSRRVIAAWLPAMVGILTLAATTSSAGELDGALETGVEGSRGAQYRVVYDARVEYDTKRKDGLKADLEIGADEDDRQVQIRDAFVSVRPSDGPWGFQFGRGKKVLGWEYDNSPEERLTIARSSVCRYLEALGIVGRDYFISTTYDLYRAAAHYNESGDMGLVLSTRWVTPSLQWANWLLLQRDSRGGRFESEWSFTAVSGVELRGGAQRFGAELYAGQDPLQTELASVVGQNRRILFGAAKVEYGIRLGVLVPYLQGNLLLPDLRYVEQRDLTGLVGVGALLHEAILLSSEVELASRHSHALATGSVLGSPTYRVALRCYLP